MKIKSLPKIMCGRAALAAGAAALLAGCVSTAPYEVAEVEGAYPDGYYGAHYAPGDRLYRGNHLKEIHGAGVTPEEARPERTRLL